MNNYNNIKKMMNDIIIMNITTTMATYIKLPHQQEIATAQPLHWSNTLFLLLQFNDNVTVKLSTSSFLFKQSKLLKSIDIDEDNNVPILCSSTYVVDEKNTFIFDDKTDLSFMFTYPSNRFLEICKFLDIIVYDNKDTSFSEQFINYALKYIKEKINEIQYFMQSEIRSIIKYNDNKMLVKCCTPIFYRLLLSEYTEEVIKYNRIDIYEEEIYKYEYYRYIHKYDNYLTYIVKQTQEYNDYIIKLNIKLCKTCSKKSNMLEIIELLDQGANINFQDRNEGNTALHNLIYTQYDLDDIKYFIEHDDINLNIPNNNGYTVLCYALLWYGDYTTSGRSYSLIQHLIEHGANIYFKRNNNGYTILHTAVSKDNNINVIQYLVNLFKENNDIDYINSQNNYGETVLHIALRKANNLEVIQYLIEHGVNVNIQNNSGNTALHNAIYHNNNLAVIKYLVEQCDADINIQNNDGNTALNRLLQLNDSVNRSDIIEYLQNIAMLQDKLQHNYYFVLS